MGEQTPTLVERLRRNADTRARYPLDDSELERETTRLLEEAAAALSPSGDGAPPARVRSLLDRWAGKAHRLTGGGVQAEACARALLECCDDLSAALSAPPAPTGEESRERMARALYMTRRRPEGEEARARRWEEWDDRMIDDKQRYYRQADTVLRLAAGGATEADRERQAAEDAERDPTGILSAARLVVKNGTRGPDGHTTASLELLRCRIAAAGLPPLAGVSQEESRGEVERLRGGMQSIVDEYAGRGNPAVILLRDLLAGGAPQEESRDDEMVEVLREALRPFAMGAVADAVSRDDYGYMRERIVDWFGPSDFRQARAAFIVSLPRDSSPGEPRTDEVEP